MKILFHIAKITTEALTELFNHETSSVSIESNETYNYWMTLSYQEQFEYFSSNEYLKDYMANDYYSSDRHLTALHAQRLAYKLNREFTNKYNRY